MDSLKHYIDNNYPCFSILYFNLAAGWTALGVGFVIFLYIVSVDADNNKKLRNTRQLLSINIAELNILTGEFESLYDGQDLIPGHHDYANDLDVLGKHSIYQYVQRCNTEQGRKLLASNFLGSVSTSEVNERHQAVKELAKLYQWRQQLQALSMHETVRLATQHRTEQWLQQREEYFTATSWKWIVWVYSFIAITTAILTILGYIPTECSQASFSCILWFQAA
jgi:hypothetical protein